MAATSSGKPSTDAPGGEGAELKARPGRPFADLSSATLNSLLNDTLDPGYRAASARDRRRRWWDGPVVWLACLAVGVLLVVAYQQSHHSAPAREAAQRELISRIEGLQSAGNAMDARAKALAAQVAALRDAQLPGSSGNLTQLEVAAGSVAVTGPGMVVELDEPPVQTSAPAGRPGTTPQTQVAVLRDLDIRDVVNALWAGGAEAIAVNGLRLTATSFIRVAGESILVDFQPISAPYTIEAIGDRDGLQVNFAESPVARRLKTMVAADGIGFRFSGKSGLRLQSVTVGQPHYASLGATASASAVGSAGPTSATPPAAASPSPTSTESR